MDSEPLDIGPINIDAMSPLATEAAVTARALVGARLEGRRPDGTTDYRAVSELLQDVVRSVLSGLQLATPSGAEEAVTRLAALLLAQTAVSSIAIDLAGLDIGVSAREILAKISEVADREGFTL